MDAFGDDPSVDDPQLEIIELDPVSKVQKRGRSVKIIGGAIALLVSIALSIGIIFYFVLPTPDRTLRTFCSALTSSDYLTLSQQFSPTLTPPFTEASTRTAFEAPLKRLGGIKDCTIGEVQQTGSQATGVMTWSFGNGSTLTFHCQLINRQDGWKVTLLTF